MIKKIHIENYKTFKELDIEFNKDINIIVGNNEAGKSTLFEAINLALTGKLYDKPIFYELSPYLFNKDTIHNFVSNIKDGNKIPPPKILIEVYLDDSFDAEYKGINNSKDEDCPGLKLSIELDNNAYSDLYGEYISKKDEIETIPIEYYTVEWLSFANKPIKSLKLPIRSQIINNLEHRYGQAASKYIASSIDYNLDKTQSCMLALKYRKLKEEFVKDPKIEELNKQFTSEKLNISDKKVEISIDVSAKNKWDSTLSLYIDDVPYSQIGKGEQNAINTKMAINANSEKSDVVLIEEPEACLSFSNLNKLIDNINDLCSGKQLFINTHSSFIMNKGGMKNTILLNKDEVFKFSELSVDTYKYFMKLPGYDTLRMILSHKSILVEGPSDELIIQKAYLDKYGKLPISDGIDVISVKGLSFLRFLEVAEVLKNKVTVVTDNDGNYNNLESKYSKYLNDTFPNIKICYSKNNSLKTLEPQMYHTQNNKVNLKTLFGKNTMSDADFEAYFTNENRKTEVALKIFEAEKNLINFPDYINDAIEQ